MVGAIAVTASSGLMDAILASARPAVANDDQRTTSTQAAATAVDDTSQAVISVPKYAHVTFKNPPATRLQDIFPPALALAIKRERLASGSNAYSAAITMTFAHDLNPEKQLNSTMSLEIASEKVFFFAMSLFSANIECNDDGKRYWLLDNGVMAIPAHEITIKGGRVEAILRVFGKDIYDAVQACPVYQDNVVSQGRCDTECISMTFSNRASDGATITLHLNGTEAEQIKNKLFR